ncbi:MAG TPA: hypothetical protein VJP59_08315 [Gemmatimonadota bacterium]|nr:hypothetical protein [Gemmatimonadota bacterium]
MNERQDLARQIQDLLAQVSGVQDVQVQEDQGGQILGIEIRVADAGEARRITRNVESALMTGLGLIVDHEMIRVVQNGRPYSGNGSEVSAEGPEASLWQDLPAQSLPEEPEMAPESPEALESRRVRLAAVRCVPDGDLYVEVTVDLEIAGQFHRGRVRDTDMPRTRLLAAARATVGAMTSALEPGTALALEGLEEFRVADTKGILAILRARVGQSRPVLHGAAIVDRDPVDAAARAVLDALNRFWALRGEAG